MTWTGLKKNLVLPHKDKVSLIDKTKRDISILHQAELLGFSGVSDAASLEVIGTAKLYGGFFESNLMYEQDQGLLWLDWTPSVGNCYSLGGEWVANLGYGIRADL